jgi:HNH endonuclease/NUMOD4 motif
MNAFLFLVVALARAFRLTPVPRNMWRVDSMKSLAPKFQHFYNASDVFVRGDVVSRHEETASPKKKKKAVRKKLVNKGPTAAPPVALKSHSALQREAEKLRKLEGEKWKVIPETAGKYSVSDQGRVRNNESMKINVGSKDSGDYLRATLYVDGAKVVRKVHHLVMQAFGTWPGPKDKVPDHKNKNWRDNRIANLRWLTRPENSKNIRTDGARPRGKDTLKTLAKAPAYHAAAKADMEWREIPGATGYEVSDRGYVRRKGQATPHRGSVIGGYRRVQIKMSGKMKKRFIYQLVWRAFKGDWDHKTHLVDHKNGDHDDDRLQNLRLITRRENDQERARPNSNNTSGVRGVWRDKNSKKETWVAEIVHDNKKRYIGRYPSLRKAKWARYRETVRLWGKANRADYKIPEGELDSGSDNE